MMATMLRLLQHGHQPAHGMPDADGEQIRMRGALTHLHMSFDGGKHMMACPRQHVTAQREAILGPVAAADTEMVNERDDETTRRHLARKAEARIARLSL